MKIDDASGKLPNLPNVNSSAGRTAISKTDDSASAGKTEKVSLSGTVQSLSAPADAPIDMAKVEKIRAAIADGSFRADAGQIADGLIAVNRELLADKAPTR